MEKANQLLENALRTKIGNNREEIIGFIQQLLKNDAGKVVWLLYRFDVDEQQLKRQLSVNEASTEAELITDALLKRCEEIIKTRKKYSSESASDLSFDLD